MRENRTCSLSGGRRLARTCADAPPPTRLKVGGRWCYLYRAIDRNGQLLDSMLSPKRDMAAAQRFFRSAQTVAGRRPEQVTTDGHNSYPRAIAEVLGKEVKLPAHPKLLGSCSRPLVRYSS
jgi:transposase-like protein